MNKFVNGLHNATNEFGYTENGAVKRTSTGTQKLKMLIKQSLMQISIIKNFFLLL